MRHLANALTLTRMAAALPLPLLSPASPGFLGLYLLCGCTDMLDGPVARWTGTAGPLGARLDSAADLVFCLCAAVGILRHMALPGWLLGIAAGVAVIRLLAWGVNGVKYRTFAPLHTWGNKAAGLLLFAFPPLAVWMGAERAGILACAAAGASALEELLIALLSRKLDREIKMIFCLYR